MEEPNFFFLLDSEVLDQVLSRLPADDVIRVGCTCRHFREQISTGRHALHLWQGHCRELLGELPMSYVTAACKAEQASTWLQLYTSSRMLDRLHWSAAAPAIKDVSVCSYSNSSEQEAYRYPHQRVVQDAAALLARTGHTATACGRLMVLIGGDFRDGPALDALDVAVLELDKCRIVQPRLHGQQPPSLQHHCTVRLVLEEGNALHEQVAAGVAQALDMQHPQSDSSAAGVCGPQHAQQLTSAGHTLLVFGGLQRDGCELLADEQLQVLWLHPDATWGMWLQPRTTGPAPAPRAFACCAAIHDSSQLLVYGGSVNGSITGTVQSDVGAFDGYLLLCVYVLDAATLTWVRMPTRPLNEPPRPGHVMLGPSTCPGPRKQALSCLRANSVTGREEFMVLGGCSVDGLADFVPYSLNLDTFYWSKGPSMGYLPPARGSCSVMRVTPTWLLLLGGQGPSREPLQDVQRLHLPTLSWKPPVDVTPSHSCVAGSSLIDRLQEGVPASCEGQALTLQQCLQAALGSAASCLTVGCSAEACVVLGGTYDGPYGRSIAPRLEVLLPGPAIPPADEVLSRGCNGSAAPPLAAVSQVFTLPTSQGLAASTQLRLGSTAGEQQQQPALRHAFATSTCRCGGCCSCLAAKAAALQTSQHSWCVGGREVLQPGKEGSQMRASASGIDSVPRWHAVSEYSHKLSDGSHLAHTCPGGANGISSNQGCGGKALPPLPGPMGWSGEFGIEPAPAAAQPYAAAAGFGRVPAGPAHYKKPDSLGRGLQMQGGAGALTGGERLWQTKEGHNEGRVLQVLLALLVVAVGLVLMAPSLMMHQDS